MRLVHSWQEEAVQAIMNLEERLGLTQRLDPGFELQSLDFT